MTEIEPEDNENPESTPKIVNKYGTHVFFLASGGFRPENIIILWQNIYSVLVS